MKTNEKHTALPWQCVTANDYKSVAVAGPGKPINAPIIAEIEMEDQECFHCDLNDEAKANARFIVAACNSHAALLEALQECVTHDGAACFNGETSRQREIAFQDRRSAV